MEFVEFMESMHSMEPMESVEFQMNQLFDPGYQLFDSRLRFSGGAPCITPQDLWNPSFS